MNSLYLARNQKSMCKRCFYSICLRSLSRKLPNAVYLFNSLRLSFTTAPFESISHKAPPRVSEAKILNESFCKRCRPKNEQIESSDADDNLRHLTATWEPWTHCIPRSGILPCEQMLLSIAVKRNNYYKQNRERQIQRQLLSYEVRLVEQGLLRGGSLRVPEGGAPNSSGLWTRSCG